MSTAKWEGLGPALAYLRRARGLSGAELADRAGLTQAMVSRYENERATPRPATLESLLTALDADRSDLEEARAQLAVRELAAHGPAPLLQALTTAFANVPDEPPVRDALADALDAIAHFCAVASAALRNCDE